MLPKPPLLNSKSTQFSRHPQKISPKSPQLHHPSPQASPQAITKIINLSDPRLIGHPSPLPPSIPPFPVTLPFSSSLPQSLLFTHLHHPELLKLLELLELLKQTLHCAQSHHKKSAVSACLTQRHIFKIIYRPPDYDWSLKLIGRVYHTDTA